jgi:hypothetical protein
MGKFLVERNESHQEIILQLDDVQRQLREMDQKIDGIAWKRRRNGWSQYGASPTTGTSFHGVLWSTQLISHAIFTSFLVFQLQRFGGFCPTSH